MASVSKRLATDETLMLLVDAVNNTETVKQAKAEIQAEGTAQVNNVKSTADEMVKDINQVPKNTSDIAELNSNLSQLSYNENSINGNIVNGTNLIGTAVREGSYALADSVVVPSGSNTISTVYFTDGTKATLNFAFSDGSSALPNPTTSDFTVSHVYFNSVHAGKIIKNIQLEIGTTTKGELYYVSSNNKLTKEIHKQNESLGDYGLDNKFDGELQQGYYKASDGTFSNSTSAVCSKNYISCKKGDNIRIKTNTVYGNIYALAYDSGGTFLGNSNTSNTNDWTFTETHDNVAYIKFDIIHSSNITPQTVGAVSVYVNNAIDELKNDLSTKIYELAGSELYLCVSGKSCVLTLNGYNLTGSTNFSKLAEYPPYLVARNVVSKKDGVCMISVDPNGNISASDLQVASSLTGQIFGEVSWVANI